jgi:hypothetical protein
MTHALRSESNYLLLRLPGNLGLGGFFVLPNLGPIPFGADEYLNASIPLGFLVLTKAPAAAFMSLVTPILSLCLRIF